MSRRVVSTSRAEFAYVVSMNVRKLLIAVEPSRVSLNPEL